MSPEARTAMVEAGMLAWDWQDRGDEHLVAAYFDALTERGFSISLDSVRDHTNCDECEGTGWVPPRHPMSEGAPVHDIAPWPCPGGSPVVWAAPPDPESETP